MRGTGRNGFARRAGCVLFVLALAASGVSSRLYAANTAVSIGNGTQQPDGSYLKAQNIANNLTVTSITIQATNNIDIVDDINLATSPFGTPHFNLQLQVPTFSLNNNMNMNALGSLFLTANTINMTGKITSGASLINPSRVTSTATQMNVLANTASIQQAIDLSSPTSPVTVQVSTGQYNENVTINKSLTLASGNPAGHVNNGQLRIGFSSATATITGASFTNAFSGIIGGIGTLDVSGLTGSGFQNHGTVEPGLSPGILSFTGAYSQASDGDLAIEIGGTTAGSQYDRLAVSGSASLDGLLHASLINGFVPSPADSFTILTASSRSGVFSNAPTTVAAGDGLFDVSYTPTSVVLGNFHPVPEPGGLALLSLCGTALLTRRRRELNGCSKGICLIDSRRRY
ncbi:MAG: hypothetical protein QOF78_1807 [Phycisphaerales bacterium]|nr:hypothetical protein [Phycisphaerales bacterium]